MIQTLRNKQNAQKPSFGELKFNNLTKKTEKLINKAIDDPFIEKPFSLVADMYDVVISPDKPIDGVPQVKAKLMMLQEPRSYQGADIIRHLPHNGEFYGEATNLKTIKTFLSKIPATVIKLQNGLLKETSEIVKNLATMLNLK